MQEDFKFGEFLIKPGTSKNIKVPFSMLSNHHPLTMDIKIIHGKHPGKTMFICAALHGDELNGIEVIRRVINSRFLSYLRGTLIAIPIVNIFGYLNQQRYLPDRRDLNRCFPGTEKGPLGFQLAHFFLNHIVKRCTHGIDLHTGSAHRKNLPQIRCDFAVEETKKLAINFGAPVVLESALREGSLRELSEKLGIPTLLFEGGEAYRLDEFSIRTAVRGVFRTMHFLGMLPKECAQLSPHKPVLSHHSHWLRAPTSGFFRSKNLLGKKIKKGEIIGKITDPLGGKSKNIIAEVSGIIIGQTQIPIVYQGDAILNVACVPQPNEAEHVVKLFKLESMINNAHHEDMRY